MSGPLRVVQVVADGAPGGGTTNVLGLAEDLAPRGVEGWVVSAPGSYAVREAARRGLHIGEIDFYGPTAWPRVRRALDRLVRDTRPHVVHVHGNRAGVLVALALPRRRAWPWVYTVRGFHFLGHSALRRWLGARAQRLAHRRADTVVWVGPGDRELARERGFVDTARGVVIPNGIVLEALPTPRPEPRRLAFLARLTYQKNPMFMVRLAALLGGDGYAVRMIGGGDEETEVRRAIRDGGLSSVISVSGALPHADALAELARSSIMILPARWEGYPTAPLEAMGMGVPVVASRVRGTTDVVRDGENGLLFAPDDVDDCAAAVRRLDGDPALHDAVVAGGHTTAAAHARGHVADRHLALYRELTSGAGISRDG